jgi:hypothetical protein
MKKKLINISALILGLILGPFSLASANASKPPIDWTSILFLFLGSFVGVLFVIGIQIFRRKEKYGRWALSFFMPASLFFFGSGISALITAVIRSELGPASCLFLIIGIGLIAGVVLSKNIYQRKLKDAL